MIVTTTSVVQLQGMLNLCMEYDLPLRLWNVFFYLKNKYFK